MTDIIEMKRHRIRYEITAFANVSDELLERIRKIVGQERPATTQARGETVAEQKRAVEAAVRRRTKAGPDVEILVCHPDDPPQTTYIDGPFILALAEIV